jgi:cytochrome c oxidase subunit 4
MSWEHEGAEDIKKHVKVYITVFAALATLTIVTVGISYLHLPTHLAIILALIVATVKGSLVACYFMHLISERTVIYWILLLCFVFFVVLMLLPTFTSPM